MNEHNDTRFETDGTDDDAMARLIARGRARAPVPAAARERVHGAVRAAWQDATGGRTVRHEKRSPSPRRGWVVPLAVAASVAAVALLVGRMPVDEVPALAPVATVAVVTGELRRADGESLRVGAQIGPGAEVLTGTAGRAALALSDGTSIRLDRATRLTLVADARLRLDGGAVYVDTAPAGADAAGVTLVTPYATARDLGTQFEVRIDNDSTLVRVREGSVAVSPRQERSRHVSRAGETARVAASGEVDTGRVARDDASWQWALEVAPPFDVAGGGSLAQFLSWSARELGLELRYDDGVERAAGTITLSGSVAGMTPRDALTAVMATTALDYRVEDGQLQVYRPADRP